jgi:hypothetical protein
MTLTYNQYLELVTKGNELTGGKYKVMTESEYKKSVKLSEEAQHYNY